MTSRTLETFLRSSAAKVRKKLYDILDLIYNCNCLSFYKALTTLANSEFHFTRAQEASIPSKVDMFTFMKICDDVLGIKPQ